MKKVFISKKAMILALLTYMEKTKEVWSMIPKIVAAVEKLKLIYQNIEKAEEKQEKAKVSLGVYKAQLKAQMATSGDELNNLLEVFATMEGNQALAQKMGDSKSKLLALSYENLKLRINTILTAAKENKEILIAEYGMVTEQITELESLINEFVAVEGKPREYKIESGIATEELEMYFKQSSDVLQNELDKLITLFRSRNPEFYLGYKRARIIVD